MELEDIKRNLNREVIQRTNGKAAVYRLTGCILRRGQDGALFYQAELTDVRSHGDSIVVCRLSDVEEVRE